MFVTGPCISAPATFACGPQQIYYECMMIMGFLFFWGGGGGRTVYCTEHTTHAPTLLTRSSICKFEIRRFSSSLECGGGGKCTSILTVTGTCRWTGYDFAVITIDTGYLNRPNWLLADYSVYHRVASQPSMFMTGPRSRYQRRCARDATDLLWMYESPSVPV